MQRCQTEQRLVGLVAERKLKPRWIAVEAAPKLLIAAVVAAPRAIAVLAHSRQVVALTICGSQLGRSWHQAGLHGRDTERRVGVLGVTRAPWASATVQQR